METTVEISVEERIERDLAPFDAAERAAIADVRATAARAAAAAAAQIIGSHHDAAADRALVDQTIAGLGTTRLN